MDGPSMVPGLVLPCCHRALVQAEGGDDVLDRATIGQQGDDADEHRRVLVQAVEGSARRGGEGSAADRTAVATLGVGVDLDVALGGLTPGRATGVGTELGLGVHGWAPTASDWWSPNRQNPPWPPA